MLSRVRRMSRPARIALYLVLLLLTAALVRAFSPPLMAWGFVTSSMNPQKGAIAMSLAAKLRRNFPPGTEEHVLVSALKRETFLPTSSPPRCLPLTDENRATARVDFIQCPYYNQARALYYTWLAPLPTCVNRIGVGWGLDPRGRIGQIDTYMWQDC